MANASEHGNDLRWLLEPPAPGEARIYIAVDENAQLTPEVREALDNLIGALQDGDVQGFAFGCGSNCDLCNLDGGRGLGFACVANLGLRLPSFQPPTGGISTDLPR